MRGFNKPMSEDSKRSKRIVRQSDPLFKVVGGIRTKENDASVKHDRYLYGYAKYCRRNNLTRHSMNDSRSLGSGRDA